MLRGVYYCMCSYHIERFESQNAPGLLRLAVQNGAPWTCAHPPISQSSAREWREHFHSQTSITRCVVYFREDWTLSRPLPTIRLTTLVAVISFSVLHGHGSARRQVQRRSSGGIEGLKKRQAHVPYKSESESGLEPARLKL